MNAQDKEIYACINALLTIEEAACFDGIFEKAKSIEEQTANVKKAIKFLKDTAEHKGITLNELLQKTHEIIRTKVTQNP
jgi:predicted RNase H-like HicB family nuclease